MSINSNSTASTGFEDFYLTRPLNEKLNVIKHPTQLVAVAADIGHRFFKVGSDVFRLLQGKDREPLAKLSSSPIVRIKESTISAVQNIVGGFGKLFKGKFFTGPFQVGQGALDALDFIPSLVTDGIHIATGVTQTRNATNTVLHSKNNIDSQVATVSRPKFAHTGQKHIAPTLSI